uniref:Polyprenol dehydrogenase n=1 Tax=Gopherus evgoodei TaxID=1825980 RepID=A0A8C4VS99_9SAUR
MSLLSRALPALRLYCIGLAVALHQLLRRLRPGGPPAPVSALAPGRCVRPLHPSLLLDPSGLVLQLLDRLRKSGFSSLHCLRFRLFPTQNGNVAIVTGGAKGIGYHTVKHLARLGMHVILVEFLHCDLASMKSIRQFVQQFRAKNCPLHVLVNNAGVMLVPERKTEDGFEEHFGLNYLGHFLLTNLLLETLKQSGTRSRNARVITVSSATHYVGRLHLNDLQSRCSYSPHGAYAQSKLALVLFTYRLQHLMTADGSHVTANVVDPGVVNTELYKNVCWATKVVKWMTAWLFFKTPEEGASTSIYAAVSPELEGVGGIYLYNEQRTKSTDVSYDEELQRRLWTESCKMTRISDVGSRDL